MKKLNSFLIFGFFAFFLSKAQIDSNSKINCYNPYYSINKALKCTHDSVTGLYIGNLDLEVFPKEIFKFKNLFKLDLRNRNICQLYYENPDCLSTNDKYEVLEIFKKSTIDKINIEGYAPKYRKTRIRKIPKEIKTLKELRIIYLEREFFSKREVRKLKRWLPKCNIEVNPYFYYNKKGKLKFKDAKGRSGMPLDEEDEKLYKEERRK